MIREILQLFDPHGFIPRRMCGAWTPGMLLLHQSSDGVIWAANMILAVMVWKLYRAWRQGRLDTECVARNAKMLMLALVMFMIFDGVSHLHQVIVFWYPVYRWFGLWSALTAIVSIFRVGALSLVLGLALRPKAVTHGG